MRGLNGSQVLNRELKIMMLYCCLAKERTADAKWRCASRCSSARPRFEHADHQPYTSRQYHSGCSRQVSGPTDSRARAELHRKLHWKVRMGRIGGSFFRQTAISGNPMSDCACGAVGPPYDKGPVSTRSDSSYPTG